MKTGSNEGELRLNGPAATQTRKRFFGNIGQVSMERLTVECFFREYFETIGRFGFST